MNEEGVARTNRTYEVDLHGLSFSGLGTAMRKSKMLIDPQHGEHDRVVAACNATRRLAAGSHSIELAFSSSNSSS
jgi:hypothetical protein